MPTLPRTRTPSLSYGGARPCGLEGIGSPAFGTISTEKCTTSGPVLERTRPSRSGLASSTAASSFISRGAADYLFAVVAGQLRERLVDEAEDAGLVDDVHGVPERVDDRRVAVGDLAGPVLFDRLLDPVREPAELLGTALLEVPGDSRVKRLAGDLSDPFPV